MWNLSFFVTHNAVVGLAWISYAHISLLDKVLLEGLFRIMVANEVVNDLILAGFERDTNQKTIEIKTFTIADVMAPTKKVLSDENLFDVLASAFDKTAHMLEDLQSKLGVDYIFMRS